MTETEQADKSTWYQLNHYKVIAITGEDWQRFLQGQVTCDAPRAENGPQAGAVLVPSGRIISNFWLLHQDTQSALMLVPAALCEKLLTHLKKFAVFFKVTLQEEQSLALCWQLASTSASSAGDSEAQQWHDNNALMVQLPFAGVVIRIGGEAAAQSADNQWHKQQIMAGLANITPSSTELFLPHDLNFDLIGAVAFRKGCYAGQEVVSRMHYKAKKLKRTFLGETAANEIPEPGSALFNDRGKAVATLVNAVQVTDSQSVLLFSCLPDKSDKIFTDEALTTPVKLLSLPYNL